MDLEELNKQMQLFQNDFNTNTAPPPNLSGHSSQTNAAALSYQQQLQNINAINFNNPVPGEIPFSTTQIKRPTKSGEHRNDINDKLSNLNMFQPMGNDIIPPNMMPQHSRSNSNYEGSEPHSPLTNYYNQNFNTLQQQQHLPQQHLPLQHQQQNQNTMNNIIAQQNDFSNGQNIMAETHNNGMTFVNVRNMMAQPIQNQQQNAAYHTAGYHKIEEKRSDYRQNMNSKLDNFIFDNPNATPFNPILQQNNINNPNQPFGYSRDTRMVIQDSNKDYYRQEANSRMSLYSPLSRASNIPITMANMSVNDFYNNMNSQHTPNTQNIVSSYGTGLPTLNEDKKAVMNSRLGQFAPLAKTIQYQTQQQQLHNPPQQQTQYWNDVNKQSQMVYNQPMPVMSNK
jgi:hypothetical protein